MEDARRSRCPPLSPSPLPHRRGGRGDDEEIGNGPLLAPGKALPGGSFSCRLRSPAAEEDDDGAASARVALKLASLTALL
uniref:Uncharacterized protein n=1 Tax=Oryza glumipatula TaxID=40148 RepID=A0A0E0B8H4_9ORYZ